MKVKIDLEGGVLRIFLAERGAAGQISLRNTGLEGDIQLNMLMLIEMLTVESIFVYNDIVTKYIYIDNFL